MALTYTNVIPVQGTTIAGSTMPNRGLSWLGASTTGPTYTMGGPAGVGIPKFIAIQSATSNASSCVIQGATTDIVFGIGGNNQITLTSTGKQTGCILVGAAANQWAVCSGGSVVVGAQTT